YLEHPSYVPLLRRAYELWADLETEAGEQLFHKTGGLDIGPPGSHVVEGSLRSCQEHDLPHVVLNGAEVNARYPAYNLPADYRAIYQPNAGFLLPERSIVAFVNGAFRFGGEVHAREAVLGWEPAGNGVRVTTDHGVYEAGSLVITAGAWSSRALPWLEGLAVPERQVLAWLQPSAPDLFTPARFPVFILDQGDEYFYGFPVFEVPGFKFGWYHHRRETGEPEALIDQAPDRVDEDALRAFAACFFPQGNGPTMSLRTCMFTNSPDEHFIVDTLPDDDRVVVASPCSGHGFKFASVIGEIAADLAISASTSHDIGLFQLDRFAGKSS
ncbi:MAG: N-methyl-L-tryptophan oxidase, partial [Anaerolineae bacterium]|nr:N-methyl-L-tryptophan oxidase [Anaerolineae bacterium]